MDGLVVTVVRGCVGGLVTGAPVVWVDRAVVVVRADAAPHSHTPMASFLVPPATPRRDSCLVWPALLRFSRHRIIFSSSTTHTSHCGVARHCARHCAGCHGVPAFSGLSFAIVLPK